MKNLKHPALPALAAFGLFGLWSLVWFVMAARIEGEIETWVERQAHHGTQVSYADLDVSGYPFRLVATFKTPEIMSREDGRALGWTGERLRLIAQAWNFNHIIIELLGPQSVTWLNRVDDSAGRMTVDFTGERLRGSLKLKNGGIESIDTDFRDVVADTSQMGTFGLLPEFPGHIEIANLEFHSRQGKAARDVVALAEGIEGGKPPGDGMSEGIEEIFLAFSEERTGKSALHSGDIGAGKTSEPAKRLVIHEARLLRPPLSLRLQGELTRPRGRNFDGNLTLALKGHEDLVRRLAEDGDLPRPAAIAAGALFGILSLVSETNEAGELEIPLDVKNGDVWFGFLPLLSRQDMRRE